MYRKMSRAAVLLAKRVGGTSGALKWCSCCVLVWWNFWERWRSCGFWRFFGTVMQSGELGRRQFVPLFQHFPFVFSNIMIISSSLMIHNQQSLLFGSSAEDSHSPFSVMNVVPLGNHTSQAPPSFVAEGGNFIFATLYSFSSKLEWVPLSSRGQPPFRLSNRGARSDEWHSSGWCPFAWLGRTSATLRWKRPPFRKKGHVIKITSPSHFIPSGWPHSCRYDVIGKKDIVDTTVTEQWFLTFTWRWICVIWVILLTAFLGDLSVFGAILVLFSFQIWRNHSWGSNFPIKCSRGLWMAL